MLIGTKQKIPIFLEQQIENVLLCVSFAIHLELESLIF